MSHIVVNVATEVVRKRQPCAVMSAAPQIDAQSFADRGEPKILVANVNHRAADRSRELGAIVEGLVLDGRAHYHLPVWDVGLEQPLQRNSAGVLPFLQRRRGLRPGRWD